jgi:hypothetical protein
MAGGYELSLDSRCFLCSLDGIIHARLRIHMRVLSFASVILFLFTINNNVIGGRSVAEPQTRRNRQPSPYSPTNLEKETNTLSRLLLLLLFLTYEGFPTTPRSADVLRWTDTQKQKRVKVKIDVPSSLMLLLALLVLAFEGVNEGGYLRRVGGFNRLETCREQSVPV